jgi:hypothetical protein
MLERNPIHAWCDGKGTGGIPYFSYENEVLESSISVDDTACLSNLSEL